MVLKKMMCPYCHGNVHVDTNRDTNTAYCTYCGQTLLFDDGRQRKDINITKYEHKQYTDDADVIRANAEAEEKKRDSKIALWVLLGCILLLLLLFTIPYISHKIHIAELEDLVVEAQELIDKGEYDKARVKAAEIVDDSGWSSDSEKKWNGIRKELIKQIDEAEAASKKMAILDAWKQIGKD